MLCQKAANSFKPRLLSGELFGSDFLANIGFANFAKSDVWLREGGLSVFFGNCVEYWLCRKQLVTLL
jgi:hypothetical protein